jgi:tripartite-type tricarboxylate transporter receptor subunit TctC
MAHLVRRTACLIAGLVVVLSWAPLCSSAAEDVWPARALKFVVPSSPGGGTDLYARLLAEALREPLKQPVLVENRAGGGGNIGAEAVAKAPPDGYTYLVTGNPSLIINPSLYKHLTYSAERDFVPIARGVVNPLVLCVLPELKVKSVEELIALGKRDPASIPYGSAGATTATYFGVRLLEEASGARFIHVPYKGSGQAYQGLLGGQVKFMLPDLGTALPHIRAGKLLPIAVTHPTRQLPDVPTFSDLGYPASDVNAVFSVVAPMATPEAIVWRMSVEINKAMKSPWLAPKLDDAVFIPMFDTPETFAVILKKERETWAAIIRRWGISLDQ